MSNRCYHRWAALILMLALVGSSASLAQQRPPFQDSNSGVTRQQAAEILNELRAIRDLLEKQNRPVGRGQPMPEGPQTGKLRLDGGYSLGSNEAPLTIVEFTDYQCSYCRTFETTTFAELRKKYIDTGRVRFVIRDFPLVNIHADALGAAQAAHCAGDQGKFWPMHDALFSDPGKLVKDELVRSAERLNLDMRAFHTCLDSGIHKLEIQNEQQVASSLQINATPSFLIGKMSGGELSGSIIVGAQPLTVFETKLREAEAAH